jgi:hypothetical protein
VELPNAGKRRKDRLRSGAVAHGHRHPAAGPAGGRLAHPVLGGRRIRAAQRISRRCVLEVIDAGSSASLSSTPLMVRVRKDA